MFFGFINNNTKSEDKLSELIIETQKYELRLWKNSTTTEQCVLLTGLEIGSLVAILSSPDAPQMAQHTSRIGNFISIFFVGKT